MRIAITAVGEVGLRVARILGAEPDLVALGVYGDVPGLAQDRRTIRISSLDGFDALVTDDVESSSALAGLAADDGLSCAVPQAVTADVAARFTDSALVTNCSLAGLAETLSVHESARTDQPLEAVISWTEPGKPLRRGTPAAFPDPVGARWGQRVGSAGKTTRVAVPVDGRWAGATATVVGTVEGETRTRIVGVADEGKHLTALALAAGAVAAATTSLTGAIQPSDMAGEYLATLLRMGMGVASYELD